MNTGKKQRAPYMPRTVDSLIEERLKIAGAIVLEGPRACGKTRTGLESSNTAYFLDTRQTRALIEVAPDLVLQGDPPILLDEWQLDPQLWNEVRRAVDATPDAGQFILTGSSVPNDDITRHTGAGRFVRIRMRTMTWHEKGVSDVRVSLSHLLAGASVDPTGAIMEYPDLIEALLKSGFPAQTEFSGKSVRPLLDAYLSEVTHTDVFRIADLRTEPSAIAQLVKSLARNTATEVSYTTLAKDVRAVSPSFSPETAANVVSLLERLFVVEKVPAFAPKLRSKARLRTSPKYHLADPALAAAALDATEQNLYKDPQTAGFLFESAVVHDLLVCMESIGGKVWHYRNSNGQEIDAILTFPDGSWAGVEVKLGASQIQEGAQSLLDAASVIDAGEPRFLAVITGTGPSATLKNGVFTFPLAALRP